MVEVFKNLFVGVVDEIPEIEKFPEFFIIAAAKEPYHRRLVGYTGKGCPKDNSQYLFAEKGNILALNLIDVNDVSFISPLIIDKAVYSAREALECGKKVFVGCNQGESRSPTIALLILSKGFPFEFNAAKEQFIKIYPNYSPKNGMLEYAKNNWNKYRSE